MMTAEPSREECQQRIPGYASELTFYAAQVEEELELPGVIFDISFQIGRATEFSFCSTRVSYHNAS